MSQVLAQITCPSCQQPFTAPVERILDVDLDPTARSRVLSNQVNLVACPHCGAAGAVPIPFLYHDASKELALVFMPMEAGRSDVERQQIIGTLSRMVLNQMPQEQRKSYLLNPQVFFSYDSLVKKILEEEGITEEMLEAQRERGELLGRLLEASSEERATLIQENEELLDSDFFQILQANMAQLEAMGQESLTERLEEVQEQLFELTPVGREVAQRAERLESLREKPTRENLLNLLVGSEDPGLRRILIGMGQGLLDYLFFQRLTRRIEAAESEEEREALRSLRRELLDVREEMREAAQQAVQRRVELIEGLLETEQPRLLARRRMGQMDDLFFNILASEVEEAQGDEERSAQLQDLWQLLVDMFQEQVPPELVLLNQLLETEDLEEARQILQENQPMVQEPFVRMLEQIENQVREEGESPETADRIAEIRKMARGMVGSGKKEEEKSKKGPGGLEIVT